MFTAGGGGSNGSRVRLWKLELQHLVDEINIPIHVSRLSTGTRKWNKIEYPLFSYIISHEVIVSFIAGTTTQSGLKLHAELDDSLSLSGIKASDREFENMRIPWNKFHNEWNCRIDPNTGKRGFESGGTVLLLSLCFSSALDFLAELKTSI
jgi:hypothetical protein